MDVHGVSEARRSRPVYRPWVRGLGAAAALAVTASVSCGRGASQADTDPMGIVEDALGFTTEGMLARQARAENLIRDCMKEQGFEYVPTDPEAQRNELLGVQGMSEEDFERQYGYGITTLYEQRRQQQEKPGPNAAFRAMLSEADQAAYDRALFGDDPDATLADAMDTGEFSRLGGCTKQAADQIFGGSDVVRTLTQKLDELDEAILADARMVEAIKAWSKCMRDAGYDLADPEQVDVVLTKRLEAIVGPAEASGDPDAYDKAALAALQREEVAMVNADLLCEERRIVPVEMKVRAEYEQEFRKKNADVLTKVPAP